MRSADSVSETTSEGERTTDETTAEESQTTAADGDSAGEETLTTMVVDDETDNGADIPGFTASAAVLALVGAVLMARLR